jgi:uncharacterized protein
MGDIAWYFYPILIIVGMFAGVINTLAGNGSAVTLSLLIFLGVDANVANGTNRIGAITQCGAALLAYKKSGQLPFLTQKSIYLIISTFIGAMIGGYAATLFDPKTMEVVIGFMMIVMLLIILVKPERWLRETNLDININTPINFFIFFAIGIYSGFIQMGMGIMFLAALVLCARFSLKDANIIKIIIVFAFIIPVFILFVIAGHVHWVYGILLAIGQSAGAWLAAKFALQHPKANIWVHRLLIGVVLFAIAKLFDLPTVVQKLMNNF